MAIKQILATLKSVFDLPDIPLPVITAQELAIGAKFRSGISRIDTTSRVIGQCGAQGIDVGPAEDGSENISIKAKRIMVDEIMRELQTRAKIEIVIPAFAIKTNVTGTAGIIPVAGTGVNQTAVGGYGIVR